MERSRRYSHHRHHEEGRYRDMDVEEGLTDSNEQSLQDLNHTGESGDVRSPFSPTLSFRLCSGHLSVQMLIAGAKEVKSENIETQKSFPLQTASLEQRAILRA